MILDIKQEYYFPFTFRLFGLILILFGVMIWTQPMSDWLKACITAVSWILAATISTMRYGLWINTSTREYAIYTWILGLKRGEAIPYKEIEKIYVNKVNQTATVQTRVTSFTSNQNLFKAFLKFDDETKIHLDTDRNRERLLTRVKRYRAILKVTD